MATVLAYPLESGRLVGVVRGRLVEVVPGDLVQLETEGDWIRLTKPGVGVVASVPAAETTITPLDGARQRLRCASSDVDLVLGAGVELPVPEPAPEAQPAVPTPARGGMTRYWASFVVGSVIGLPLGLLTGYWRTAPGLDALGAVFPAALCVFLFFLVLFLQVWVGQPPVAALTLVSAFVLGYVVAPPVPPRTREASGYGTVGTRADPAAIWSGPVSRRWERDSYRMIRVIEGFGHTYAGVGPLAVEEVAGGFHEATVYLLDTWVSLEGGSQPSSSQPEVEFEGVSAGGRTGTAVLPDNGVMFGWTCGGGP